MNANELADSLMANYEMDGASIHVKQAATMLLRQQAEIEKLKANLEHAHGIGEAGGFIKGHKTAIAKTLTDEEIEVLASKHLCYQIEGSEVSGVFNFARAILRKAQEK